MSDQNIKCPKCGANIPLTEALTSQIETSLREKLDAESNKKAVEIENQRKALAQQAKDLDAKARDIDDQVAVKLREERKRIAEQEKARILAEQAEQTKALEQELQEKRTQIAAANKKELDLRRRQRELEEKAAAIELDVERKLATERKRISEEAGVKAAEEQVLKLREKDDKIEALTRKINDLQRQAEQGSQESQGEALEGALQDSLQQAFPFDLFAEVKKGQKGGDIIQIVRNAAGKECGKILWESKRTKEFSGKWIEKLKSDQQEAGAELAVIVSVVLPKEIRCFGLYEGIWLSDFASCSSLAAALRLVLIQAARERSLSANQNTLKDVIFQYVTGQEFVMQIRAIADAFVRMKGQLDQEKRAMERIWKNREKQIETVIANISGIHGSLEGYLGSKALPPVDLFTLDAGIEDDQNEDEAAA